MAFSLKNLVKSALPHAVIEYSVRWHDYMRLGWPAAEASRKAFSVERYQAMCDARLNLLPRKILRSLRTCVDAGAHVGNWTLALLPFKPERVIALECEPRLVERLTTAMATYPSVEVVVAALAGGDGEATFYQLRHPAGSSLLKPQEGIAKEFEARSWDVIGETKVRKIGYDQLVVRESEVSVLKLDIQGAEREVLAGSVEGLQKTWSVILEVNFTQHYESDAVFGELHELMKSKGFGLYRLSPPYHRGGRVLYADAVYIKEEILGALASA